MNMETELKKLLDRDELYQGVVELARENSNGKIWLIGGYLFRRLANILYGTGNPGDGDIDFIVDRLNKDIIVEGWDVQINRFGNPKIQKNNVCVDLMPLNNILHVKRRGLEPSIENFLAGTPLTIQSVVYDIEEEKLIGDLGIQALETKTIGVNNFDSLQSAAKKKNMTPDEYLNKYTKSLVFGKI